MIAHLDTFNKEELISLLHICAHSLALAYQETQKKSFFLTSQEAYKARDYLMYEIQRQVQNQIIH